METTQGELEADSEASVRTRRGVTKQQMDGLRHSLEQLGLTPYEARVVTALLRVGEATASQLAELSGIARPNVYLRLEGLEAKGLAQRHSGKVARWTSPPRAEIVERLRAAERERLRQAEVDLEERAGQARRNLEALGPEAPPSPLPHIQLVASEVQLGVVYDRLMTEAASAVMVCNRGPYYGKVVVAPEVLDALARGVRARALYCAPEVHADGNAFRQVIDAYHHAGVAGRVVDDVPVSLAMFDSRVVLLSLPATDDPDAGFPTSVVVDHPGFAAWCQAAFEHYWDAGKPYEPEIQVSVARSS